MDLVRFQKLADELAGRDADLEPDLERARARAHLLREHAERAVEVFRSAARASGAEHLTHIEVSPVEPDEKHVDCVQFRVFRGRWEIVSVANAEGVVTLVGPFRRGKAEKPCADYPLDDARLEVALEDLLADLIGKASAR